MYRYRIFILFLFQESITKHSPSLSRDAEYIKTMGITRLPSYITIQMVGLKLTRAAPGSGVCRNFFREVRWRGGGEVNMYTIF